MLSCWGFPRLPPERCPHESAQTDGSELIHLLRVTHLRNKQLFPPSFLPPRLRPSHLWRDVVGGPTEGARGHAFVHVLLTHAEVSDLDVALRVQHHVVQLQVPATTAAGLNSPRTRRD